MVRDRISQGDEFVAAWLMPLRWNFLPLDDDKTWFNVRCGNCEGVFDRGDLPTLLDHSEKCKPIKPNVQLANDQIRLRIKFYRLAYGIPNDKLKEIADDAEKRIRRTLKRRKTIALKQCSTDVKKRFSEKRS